MQVIHKEFFNINRISEFKIVPIGDIHLGAAACREEKLKRTIEDVKKNNKYWIGMGDYGEFINTRDPRFDFDTLAKWARLEIQDLSSAQVKKFLEYTKPIAGKCLGIIKGNHEDTIHRHTENNVYSRIVTGVKSNAGLGDKDNLGLGFNGFIILDFYRGKKKQGSSRIVIYCHHGFGGGRTTGGKANKLATLLKQVDADIVIIGHTHEQITFPAARYYTDRKCNVRLKPVWGCNSGSFLDSYKMGIDTYSEKVAYSPLPIAGSEIILKPGAEKKEDRVKILSLNR